MFRRLLDGVDRWMIPLLFVVAIAFAWRMHRGTGINNVISSDGEGYYIYLPATLIYGSWEGYDGVDGLQVASCCRVNADGNVVTRYTYGVALLQAPFFLGAHAFAGSLDEPLPPADAASPHMNARKYSPLRGHATGFSDPYSWGILIAAAFYMSLGLGFLKQALRRSFRKEVAVVTTGLIFLATNLFYYTVGEGSMSHVYSFFLFAVLVYHLPEWLQAPTWGRSLLLGICLGLIVLIRPTNVLITLLFPLWAVYSWQEFRHRMKLLAWQVGKLLAMAGMAFLVLLPQAVYWKSAFGSWVAWSYGDEGFSNWMHPQVLKVLFSYQNGLFVYTPIMLLAMVGLVMAWRKRMASAPVITVIFLLATYTFASWWAWWFGGAFGHRCYVEFYAVLAFPLAVVVKQFAASRTAAVKVAGLAMALVFVYMNVKLSMMYSPPWDGEWWTWDQFMAVMRNVARVTWWPGF